MQCALGIQFRRELFISYVFNSIPKPFFVLCVPWCQLDCSCALHPVSSCIYYYFKIMITLKWQGLVHQSSPLRFFKPAFPFFCERWKVLFRIYWRCFTYKVKLENNCNGILRVGPTMNLLKLNDLRTELKFIIFPYCFHSA